MHGAKKDNQFTYDYVKLKIGYFSNKIPVWDGIFTIANYRLNYGLRNDHGIFDFNYSDISAIYDI